jgi:arabinogalactan oligomer/maltooligosaccharide transport system permease protein
MSSDIKAAENNSKARKGAILSTLFMGLGQLYNRQYVKGSLLSVSELYLIIFWTKPFINAMWGLYTLGETAQIREKGRVVYQGDHSIFLLIEGIFALLIFLIILALYLINIRDAYKTGQLRDQEKQVNNIKQSLTNVWENGFPFVLLTPAVLFIIFLTILPLVFGILIAFTNYSGPYNLPPKSLVSWVGFDTFTGLFKMKSWSTTFYSVFTWNIIWGVIATATTFFAGLLYAIMINYKKIRFKKVWRGIYILPWAIPAFVSILIMRNIFNGTFGPLNQYLQALGFEAIPWLSDPIWAKFTLVAVNMWLGLPFWLILMTGVLTGIDKEMYEAAEVDGANASQKFWKLTFPLVMFATAPLLIMSFAANFNNFTIIYLLNDGGPSNVNLSYAGSTDILITWIYKLTLDFSQFNMASVVSILLFVVIATVSIWNFRRTRAFKEEDMIQ